MVDAAQGVVVQIDRYGEGVFPNRPLGGREFPARRRSDPVANLN
jgi:hypothetical protein